MECPEARDQLADLHRGRLEPEVAERVRAHVGECAACASALQTEAAVRALVQAHAPRYAAPPGLRVRIQASMAQQAESGRTWPGWHRRRPWLVGGLASALALVLLAWAGMRWLTRDPITQLAARAVAEHVEYAREMKDRAIPDPAALVSQVQAQVNFGFEPVFRGDSQMQLVATTVTAFRDTRAAAFVYRDAGGRYTTLFLMPGAGTVIPSEDRMPIEAFKPHHRATSGHHLLLWKQRDLACVLVSDVDQKELPAVFLKIRKAT